MRFALLLCVLLFAVSISVDARRVKIHKKRTVQPISDALIDLKSTNSVLYNEVLALLEAGGPVDDILNLFYALRNDLLAEQQTAQEAHDRAKETCDKLTRENTEELERLNQEVAEAHSRLGALNEEISAKNAEIEGLQALLQSNEEESATIRASREDEYNSFVSRETTHSDAIDAIKEVIAKVEGSSLVGAALVEKVQSVAKNIKKSLRHSTAIVKALVNLEAEMTQNPDELNKKEKVERILVLLHQLLEQLQNSLDVIRKEEEESKESYEVLIAHLDKQHNDLIEDIAQLQGSISGLGSEIADKEELVSLLEPQIQDARAVLDSLIARCNLQEAHYAEDNERRDEEIRVIDECIEILKGRVASATPGICGQCGLNAHCENELCACNDGFEGNGFDCVEVDPCAAGTDNCDVSAECVHTEPGEFECHCNAGYVGDGTFCVEINPCDLDEDDCDANAVCTHTGPGQHECVCNEGYEGDGVSCSSINPCSKGIDSCDANAVCSHTGPGSYSCACNEGYEGDGYACAPIPANNGALQIVDDFHGFLYGDHFFATSPPSAGSVNRNTVCAKFGRSAFPQTQIVPATGSMNREFMIQVSEGLGLSFKENSGWCCANTAFCITTLGFCGHDAYGARYLEWSSSIGRHNTNAQPIVICNP